MALLEDLALNLDWTSEGPGLTVALAESSVAEKQKIFMVPVKCHFNVPPTTKDTALPCKLLFRPDKSGELDFCTFLSMMHKQIQQENPQAEILQAMRMMDPKNQGFILVSELMGHGERLTDQEVDELLNDASVISDGRMDYEEFVKMAAAPSGQR